MHFTFFEQLNLEFNDFIWIMNEKGEIFHGRYLGDYDRGSRTFLFSNYSNGQTEKLVLDKLQNVGRN